MAYVAGTYSASQMTEVLAKENELVQTSRQQELSRPIVAGAAILQNQDINIEGIQFSGEECIMAKATNIRAASMLAADKTVACTVTAGIEAGTDSITFAKEVLTKPARFTIMDSECNNTYTLQDRLAYHSLKAKIDLEVELSAVLVAFAATNADVPDPTWFQSTTVTPVVDDVNTLEIATVDWTGALLADFAAIKQLAVMPNSIILSGRNLWNKTLLAQFEANYATTNNQVLVGQNFFDMYFDLMNVDQTLGDKSTLMLDKNSILFWSSPVHQNLATPQLMTSDTYIWSDMLPRLQYMANGRMNPIYIDVKATRFCASGTSYGWRYEYVLRGALSLNMPNVNGDYGILRFRNVATPANE